MVGRYTQIRTSWPYVSLYIFPVDRNYLCRSLNLKLKRIWEGFAVKILKFNNWKFAITSCQTQEFYIKWIVVKNEMFKCDYLINLTGSASGIGTSPATSNTSLNKEIVDTLKIWESSRGDYHWWSGIFIPCRHADFMGQNL